MRSEDVIAHVDRFRRTPFAKRDDVSTMSSLQMHSLKVKKPVEDARQMCTNVHLVHRRLHTMHDLPRKGYGSCVANESCKLCGARRGGKADAKRD